MKKRKNLKLNNCIKKELIKVLFYSSVFSLYLTNTSLGLELPVAGPMIPFSSNSSIIVAALLYPILNFLCNNDALALPVLTT